MEELLGSLERRLQRPVLAKSLTLPSIPQSPTVARVIGESVPCRQLPSRPDQSKACTLPPAGDLWRLEDEEDDTEVESRRGCETRLRSHSPFSHFRSRTSYLRKSVSVDDQLGTTNCGPAHAEGRGLHGGKSKLKRKFSLGSADRRDSSQARAESVRMTQAPEPLPSQRKTSSVSSPSAARRLYRNLSGKFRVGTTGLEDNALSGRDKDRLCKSSVFQGAEALFEAVEHQDLDMVQSLLSHFSPEELDLNTPNSEGLLPLDIAIMTNNTPMAKLLLCAGAKESPHFVSLEGRAIHLETLVREAEQRVAELVSRVTGEGPDEREELKAWEWKLRLYRRMETGFHHSSPPDAPSKVCLSVSSSSSLRVQFQEPLCVNSATVTKYKVGWSLSPSFSPLLGEMLIEDITQHQCDIISLVAGTYYYVQVSAHNMKGWGPVQMAVPACAAPSSWRDVDGRLPRQRGQKEALEKLFSQIRDGHRQCACHDQFKSAPHVRKHSVSKSLRHLFQPSSKFVKSLKRGLYLTCILYRDDNVLVTPEDQIPIVEVDDSYSSLTQDFLWFTKMSYLWEEVSWLQQCVSSAQSSCSCTLQTRLKMLQAVEHLQSLLGTQDMGQVYFEPIRDKHGNALLVLLRDMGLCGGVESLRWTPLGKLQFLRKSLSSPEEPTALDILLITLHEKLAYHQCSRTLLSPGLYLGYLKFFSTVEQIRVLVPQKLPNVLCHAKIRDNGHVSREEWQSLQAVRSLEEVQKMSTDEQSAAHNFMQELHWAAQGLLSQTNVPKQQAQEFRISTQEVCEFGEGVSFLLLLPPCEDVCSAPGQNQPYSPRAGLITLPLQIFELVHFKAYNSAYITQFCRVSGLLGLESLMSQQALREAFSESELFAAKNKQQQVQEYIQQMEELWRDSRWIMDALQNARYKQPVGGISLSCIIDFSQEASEVQRSTSSAPEYLPSPPPSPDAHRKHLDVAGLSDEEGSSEVFLTTDSDYDSSRAQSPRELDLLPSSPGVCGGGWVAPGSRPDVVQTGAVRARSVCNEAFDSDFILPSRQIELLRITEKRQALCVRTSSLEHPVPVTIHTSSPGPSPQHLCPAHKPRPRPLRAQSADSGVQRLSARSSSPSNSSWQTTLRIYPQYPTGLPKETSVKLRVTCDTSAREMVQLVVQEMNAVSQQLLGAGECCGYGPEGCECRPGACACSPVARVYGPEHLEHFGLVLVLEEQVKWLRDDFRPLLLQNPWSRGRLCVRIKEYSPLAMQHSRATTV
ncbi:ankyrin repeat and fibronectin type-III domain-containing protein 1 isoform X2 [Denticeps clupeoides]|nr:ankyrin repeat and fibronectin type-III domain-containing protein 1-like isoform X2 [Denticeps clupeoides]